MDDRFAGLASFYLSSMNIGNHGHFHMSGGGPTINGVMSSTSGPSQAGPSSSNLMKCPECHQTFSEVVSLFAHAAHTHYWNILASLFMSDFLLINGKCRVCNRGPKLKSVNAYIKHMGGKHRLINKFMTPEVLCEYSKFPTTQQEYQDVQALLDMADQPERTLMKKVKEKEKGGKRLGQLNASTSYSHAMDGSYPQLPLPPSFNPNMSHFLAMGSSSFSDHLSHAQAEPDLRTLTKKGRIRKANLHDPFKCPECDCTFENVSTLYTHSAGKHYYAQLHELFKTNFMRENGMCTGCPNRPINDVQSYVLHVGAKHKMIHRFISPDMLREYDKLPAKRINSSYTTVKNASLINCVVCGVNAKRKFSNITEYKQHLAIFHFRNQISAAYMTNYPNSSTELTCTICDSQQESGRNFKSFYALVVHLGSKHNCILDFADEALRAQLHLFNVFKN